ncbi:dipeptidase [Pseudogemmobacter humi]|uniref:Membrane dipeptidase (Peptidase family M19) n=1 Tax=Pseudogemmobacter humi TaxID=2483812 RepID=A0A3P5WL17_9RHOB|nr:dipeptidase [Pseudogemmobacter humi]VDC22368.1 Membrane dipeptidase (Peptidase family M19) [Pseudogemmobacter humi]
MSRLHDDLIVFDGLIVSNFDRSVYEDMRKGGVTAANCTCCVWENFHDTMRNMARLRQDFVAHSDLITQVCKVQDIYDARDQGKTGMILGWQNTSGLEDRIEYLELFYRLGLRIVQLTYNTQNYVGSGCYESVDSGLSDFGRDVLAGMNSLGILCDLSHVGPKTSEDAILASTKRVAYSHCLPAGLKAHPRNKTDEQLRFIAGHDGFVGVTMFPPFLKNGTRSDVSDYVEAIEYVINIVGEDAVGIGTDFTQGYDASFFEWISRDKGTGRLLTDLGEIVNPAGMREIGDFPNLTAAMEKRGWPVGRIEKIMGENWVQLLKDVWVE